MLGELLSVQTRIRVALLLGNHAGDVWHRLGHSHPDLIDPIRAIRTRSASQRALISSNPDQRAAWMREQQEAFARAAHTVHGTEGTAPSWTLSATSKSPSPLG